MINLSGVEGNMRLRGEWTDNMIDNLNVIVGEWSKWQDNDFMRNAIFNYHSLGLCRLGVYSDDIQALMELTKCNFNYDVSGYFENKKDNISFGTSAWSNYLDKFECIGFDISRSKNLNTIKAYNELCEELSKCIDENNLPTAWIDVHFKEYVMNKELLSECEAEIKLYNRHLTGFIKEIENYNCPFDDYYGDFFHDCKLSENELQKLTIYKPTKTELLIRSRRKISS